MGWILEIHKDRWETYLRLLNRHIAAQPTRVEVEMLEFGDQEAGKELPLRAIDYDTKGSQRGDILLLVGWEHEASGHRVSRPTRMYMALNDAAELDCLELENAEGAKTLVHFEHLPALPFSPAP